MRVKILLGSSMATSAVGELFDEPIGSKLVTGRKAAVQAASFAGGYDCIKKELSLYCVKNFRDLLYKIVD
jgi:hypothetical protein